MKRFLPVLLLAYSITFSINAQTPTIKWSKKRTEISCFDPVIHNGVCYAASQGFTSREPRIGKFDYTNDTMLLENIFNEEKLMPGYGMDRYTQLISTPYGLHLLCRDRNRNGLVVFNVDTENLVIRDKLFYTEQLYGFENACCIQSADREKFCIYSIRNAYPEAGRSITRIKLSVLNAKDLSLTYEIEAELDKSYDYNSFNLCLANNGDVVITAGTYFSDRKSNESVTSLICVSNGKVLSNKTFKVDGKNLNVGLLKETPQGIVIVGDYNSGPVSRVWSEGWYYVCLNTITHEIVSKHLYPYSQQIFALDKSAKKGLISEFRPKSIVVLKNNKIRVLFEKYRITSHESISDGLIDKTWYVTSSYPNSGLFKVVYGADTDGNVEFESIVNTRGSNVNNHPIMFETENQSVVIIYVAGNLFYTIVDANGKEITSIIKGKHTSDVYPRATVQIDDNRFIIYNWKIFRLAAYGTLTFN